MKKNGEVAFSKKSALMASRREAVKFLGGAAATPMAALLLGAHRGAEAPADAGPETVYELRIYHANGDKLPLLLERFRKREVKIFARLGMHICGYWTITEPADEANCLVYLLRHPTRAFADDVWKRFSADPEWLVVKAETEKDGPLVGKHDRYFMQLTDFSPVV